MTLCPVDGDNGCLNRVEYVRVAHPTRKERRSLLAAHAERWAPKGFILKSVVSFTTESQTHGEDL
jgi:hypothetical protein